MPNPVKVALLPRIVFFFCATTFQIVALGQASVVPGSVSNSKINYSPGVGNNRLIVVAVSNENNNNVRTVTSITWGGQNLTFAVGRTNAGAGGDDLRAEIWYLNEAGINAASGYCNDFIVTWSGATTEVFTVFTLKDVDQTTPVAATGTGSPAGGGTTTTTSSMAAGVNDIACYASATRANATHTPPTGYTELSDQVISSTTALATAYKQITTAGNETPTATWSVSDQLVIAGVVFNGVAETGGTTYYSRNATSGGNWNSNTSWTTNPDGSGGPLAAGEWPRRFDNVVILSGHTITIDAIDDNKSCGVSPDGLGRSNVGPFVSSNLAMFYHTGDITVHGTLNVTGIEMMVEGYTHILSGGSFTLTSNLVNLGFLEADAGSTLSSLDDLVVTGNSNTIINTNSTSTDDLIIDHTDATVCGTGTATLQNGAGSQITYTNGATVAQICTAFTVVCTGMGCTGFPVTGTGTSFGNRGPGGVGQSSTNSMWYMANFGTFTDAGITPANNGDQIRQWNDRSGNNRHATQTTAANRPLLKTNANNGYPALRFTGDLFIDGPSPGIASNSSYTYLIVFRDTLGPGVGLGGTNDGNGHFILDRTSATNELVSLKPVTGNRYFYQKRNNAGAGLGGVTGTTPINTNIKIIQMRRNFNVNYQMFYNNVQEGGNLNDSDGATTPPSPRIGRHATTNNGGIRGFISEFIVYNYAISTAERIIINNYLAAKYGLALGADDVYAMDNPANGNYDHEVAGIGQAADGSKHTDARGTGVVRMVIQSPPSLSNNEFLLWGHDNASMTSNFADIDNVIIKERLNRVWRVSEVGDVGNVSVSFDISSLPGSPVGADLRLLIDRDGDGFADNDVTPIAGGTLAGSVITFTGINLQNGDRFTLGNTNLAAPLPVELVFFRAKANGSLVDITWRTASETKNDFFTIERSADASEWMMLATVPGKGNSTTRTDYAVVDDNPVVGTNYYRLKQTDFDGTFTYSEVISAVVEMNESIQVYPNPAQESFIIKASFELNPSLVRIFDQVGKPASISIRSGETPRQLVIDSSTLTPGLYVLQVTNGRLVRTVRVIIR